MPTTIARSQASRAGSIATIVVTLILNGLLSVLYFTQGSESQKLRAQVAEVTRKYAEAVSEPVLSSAEYAGYKEKAKAVNLSVIEMLSAQQKEVATSVAGQPMNGPELRERVEQANKRANQAVKEYSSKADLKLAAGTNLLETLNQWPHVVDKTIEQREQLKQELAAQAEQMKATDAANQLALAEKDKAIAEAKADTARVTERFSAFQQQHSKALEDVQAGASRSVQNMAQQVADLQSQVAARDKDNENLKQQVSAVELVIRRFKANPATKEAPIRVPDGQITTVAGNECFIDLGQGDQISVGMTFEVYDRVKGIPPLGSGVMSTESASRKLAGIGGTKSVASRILGEYAYDLPVGKGSIEVMSVGRDHTSQCRIIHVEPNQTISQSDVIANLVYDRNVKFNFFVYGDFDLHNGRNGKKSNDGPVIRGLIDQWGGQVQPIADDAKPADSVTPDTSFIVIGREPVVKNYTAEEQTDPRIKWNIDQALLKLSAYKSVLDKADKYGIPVLNQERFLYYTGFFDQAGR